MSKHDHEPGLPRSFQRARTPGCSAAGVAAAVAMASFAFLVFGPLADERVAAFAGAGGVASGSPAELPKGSEQDAMVPPAPASAAERAGSLRVAGAAGRSAPSLSAGLRAGLKVGPTFP